MGWMRSEIYLPLSLPPSHFLVLGVAVGQGVELGGVLIARLVVCPQLLHAVCQSVLEQDIEPQVPPNGQSSALQVNG